MSILQLEAYLVGGVSSHAHHTQKRLWIIGNEDYMKCQPGSVLELPIH
jgi:hypothetical protein